MSYKLITIIFFLLSMITLVFVGINYIDENREEVFYNPEKHQLKLNVTLVTGKEKIIYCTVPKTAYLFIRTRQGSYWLEYRTDECSNSNCFGVIKAGVVDFEIIK